MERHFVNYNQALALKELGFDEPCLGWYLPETVDKGNIPSVILGSYLTKWNKFGDRLSSPLKSQVFKWFRKNHSINGIVSYYGKGQWNIEILDYKGNELIQMEDNTFWSYEEAESACIDKLIEIVKAK